AAAVAADRRPHAAQDDDFPCVAHREFSCEWIAVTLRPDCNPHTNLRASVRRSRNLVEFPGKSKSRDCRRACGFSDGVRKRRSAYSWCADCSRPVLAPLLSEKPRNTRTTRKKD